jgi:hypothetical protein
MKDRYLKNIPHSIRERLFQLSKAKHRPFMEYLQYFAMERFLFRLGQSKYAHQFILKGGLLLQILQGQESRTTKDIDMLGRIDNSIDNIMAVVSECLKSNFPDGIVFDSVNIRTQEIKKDAEYQGVRVTIKWSLAQVVGNLQVDFGFGDVVTPNPEWIDYPELLDLGMPHILIYPKETIIAEKFQAMIDLDLPNTRLKDFFDIWSLSRTLNFRGDILSLAIKKTFERRSTPMPVEIPSPLTEEFYGNPIKQSLWKAFLNQLIDPIDAELAEVISSIRDFLMPLCAAINNGQPFDKEWPAGGPWHSK